MISFSGKDGIHGDGDIFREHNLDAFRKFVIENTDGKGVHFVMADGVSTRLQIHTFVRGVQGNPFTC